MSPYRQALPQLSDKHFITDGGLETTLIFHNNLELPLFASFTLLETEAGRQHLHDYFVSYINLAKKYRAGIILESATWRANSDWSRQLGYGDSDTAAINQLAIDQLHQLRLAHQSKDTPIVVSGCIGPRGDGYIAENKMSADEAQRYHSAQIATFKNTNADMVCAMTLNYVEEAVGIARAAHQANMPVAISFTVETDGCLPTGDTLQHAIETVDRLTDRAPAYYMVNCAHPSHFETKLKSDSDWTDRIFGVRANASKCSHAELNEAKELDIGNPKELGTHYHGLQSQLSHLRILGGCCGTDQRHIEQICVACL